jgi:hypothetical protein
MQTPITWKPGETRAQDPNAALDYTMDFAPWLDGGALASCTATGSNCTAGTPTIAGTVVKWRVSDVVAGATVTLHPTTTDGQFDDFTFKYTPTPK